MAKPLSHVVFLQMRNVSKVIELVFQIKFKLVCLMHKCIPSPLGHIVLLSGVPGNGEDVCARTEATRSQDLHKYAT